MSSAAPLMVLPDSLPVSAGGGTGIPKPAVEAPPLSDDAKLAQLAAVGTKRTAAVAAAKRTADVAAAKKAYAAAVAKAKVASDAATAAAKVAGAAKRDSDAKAATRMVVSMNSAPTAEETASKAAAAASARAAKIASHANTQVATAGVHARSVIAAVSKCEQNISTLATNEHLTQREAEAVLAYIAPTCEYYEKHTLTALQVINRYAAEKGIRPEDAIVVFREYA
jgi:hypothetical protein